MPFRLGTGIPYGKFIGIQWETGIFRQDWGLKEEKFSATLRFSYVRLFFRDRRLYSRRPFIKTDNATGAAAADREPTRQIFQCNHPQKW